MRERPRRLVETERGVQRPHAALHLGPINIVLETAAMESASETAGTVDLQVESWTVMMVRPGVVGPFRATAEGMSDRSERLPVQLTLHDEGMADRVIATAVAVFRRVSVER